MSFSLIQVMIIIADKTFLFTDLVEVNVSYCFDKNSLCVWLIVFLDVFECQFYVVVCQYRFCHFQSHLVRILDSVFCHCLCITGCAAFPTAKPVDIIKKCLGHSVKRSIAYDLGQDTTFRKTDMFLSVPRVSSTALWATLASGIEEVVMRQSLYHRSWLSSTPAISKNNSSFSL